MSKKIKLRPKQLNVLNDYARQKQQLNALFQDLNKQELLLIELILEEASVTEQVTNIKVDGDSLTYDVVEKAEPKPAKGKKTKMEVIKEAE